MDYISTLKELIDEANSYLNRTDIEQYYPILDVFEDTTEFYLFMESKFKADQKDFMHIVSCVNVETTFLMYYTGCI